MIIGTRAYKNGVYLLSKQVDEKVKTLRLPALGAALHVPLRYKQIIHVSRSKAFSRVDSEPPVNISFANVLESTEVYAVPAGVVDVRTSVEGLPIPTCSVDWLIVLDFF